jgi:hypothetical protein
VSVILARGSYYVRRRHGLRWHDTYTKSYGRFGYSSNIMGMTSNLRDYSVGITDERNL